MINNSLTCRLREFALAILGGALFAISSYDGFSAGAPLLAFAGIVVLVWLANFACFSVFAIYCYGVSFYLTAFYWIPQTLELFSGFPVFVCYALFGLFAGAVSLQFYLAAYLSNFFRARTGQLAVWGLLFPLAWTGVEQLFPRMFPWAFVHPFITWRWFSGLSEFLGIFVLTFLLLWFINLLLLLIWRAKVDRNWKIRLVTAMFLLLPLYGGYVRTTQIDERLEKTASIKLAIVQPAFDAFAFMDRSVMPRHLESLMEMSEEAIDQGAKLLIWPESSISHAINEQLKTFGGTTLDYLGALRVPYIAGTVTVREAGDRSAEKKQFNTGIVVGPSGAVLGRYHKRILMPFGEYLPGADIFPALKGISPQTGDFNVGDIETPLTIKIGDRDLSIGILICYEDIVSGLSRDYLVRGVDLLVNITNDVWYGSTMALSEHNLLAAWRAIEVRSYFVRGTNTGMSSVIDPTGRMIASGKIGVPDLILADVRPGRYSDPMFNSTALALEYCLLISFWAALIWSYFRGRSAKARKNFATTPV